MTLREHLTICHWTVSNRAGIASREELGQNHPIRRLLQVCPCRPFDTGSLFLSTVFQYISSTGFGVLQRTGNFLLQVANLPISCPSSNVACRPFDSGCLPLGYSGNPGVNGVSHREGCVRISGNRSAPSAPPRSTSCRRSRSCKNRCFSTARR